MNCTTPPAAPPSLPSTAWEDAYLLTLLLLGLLSINKHVLKPSVVLAGTLTLLFASEILPLSVALGGFTSFVPYLAGVTHLVNEGFYKSNALEFANSAWNRPKEVMGRIAAIVAVLSGVVYHPGMATIKMIPAIMSKKQGAPPPSQMIMVVLFASVLGGSLSLMGSVTNLALAKLTSDYFCGDLHILNVFSVTAVGVPFTLFGLTYIVLFAPRALPDAAEYDKRRRGILGNLPEDDGDDDHELPRREGGEDNNDSFDANETQPFNDLVKRDQQMSSKFRGGRYLIHAAVLPESPVVGKTVFEAGLRGLEGLYLCSVQRGDRLFSAIGPTFLVRAGDILSFTGLVTDFVRFCANKKFVPVTSDDDDLIPQIAASSAVNTESSTLTSRRHQGQGQKNTTDRMAESNTASAHAAKQQPHDVPIMKHIVEAVIRNGSWLNGKSPKDVSFRKKYQAAILSIHRTGAKLHEPKMGKIELRVGDTLVLITSDLFDWKAPDTNRDLKETLSLTGGDAAELGDYQHSKAKRSSVRDFLLCLRFVRQAHSLEAELTVEKAGLRDLPGLFLVAVERPKLARTYRVVGPDFVLEPNDLLWFAGDRESLPTLRAIPGFEDLDSAAFESSSSFSSGNDGDDDAEYDSDDVENHAAAPRHNVEYTSLNRQNNRRLLEVVVSLRSDLLYKTVRDSQFRSRFGAAIVVVKRRGADVMGKIGDIVLLPGDVLMLDAGPDFAKSYRDEENFLVLTPIENSAPPDVRKMYFCVFLIFLLVMSFFFWLEENPLLVLVMACLVLLTMVFFRFLPVKTLNRSMPWGMMVTLACSQAICAAMLKTNVARVFANFLVDFAMFTEFDHVAVLLLLNLCTTLLSMFVADNNMAGLLMFPIAVRALEMSNRLFTVKLTHTQITLALMLSCANFINPDGAQSNLLINGPGTYTWLDYLKFGGPFTIWNLISQTFILMHYDSRTLTWSVALVIFLFAYVYDQKFRKGVSFKSLFSRVRGGGGGLKRKVTTEMMQQDTGLKNNNRKDEEDAV